MRTLTEPSWWVGLARDDFAHAADVEQPRMAGSKFGGLDYLSLHAARPETVGLPKRQDAALVDAPDGTDDL